MGQQNQEINANYENHYAKRNGTKVYPTEFVVRTFLATYAGLEFRKPVAGQRVLDIGFGDGRNTTFLCDQGYDVSGIEITQGIVDLTRERLERLGQHADLRVGRNSNIPFPDGHFDYLLACHSCYYCDDGQSLADNLREYARVLKPGGFLVASVAAQASYIFKDAIKNDDGSLTVTSDPYGNRNGYRLHGFSSPEDLKEYFSSHFSNFSLGYANNDYYGMSEQVFWVTCQKV